MSLKLVRANRPQTKNNYHLIVVEENDKQFIGMKVTPIFNSDKNHTYVGLDNPVFGENTESCAIPCYLNKHQCTDYMVTELENKELHKDDHKILDKIRDKVLK